MKFTNGTMTATGTKSNNRLTIMEQDVDKAASILIGLYGSSVTPVREIIINALEANEIAGVDSPVKVDFDTHIENENLLGSTDRSVYSSGVITITDNGDGMTKEFAETRFRSLTNSTKDKDDSGIGGFGIGSKSAMHISNNAVWRTTTADGVTTTIIMSTTTGGDGFDIDITSAYTGNERGTIVTIPVDSERMTSILEEIDDKFFNYCNPAQIEVTVAGEPHEVGGSNTYNMTNGEVCLESRDNNYGYIPVRERNDVVIISKGNVPYTYKVSHLIERLSDVRNDIDNGIALNSNGRYIIRLDLGRAHITPTREALKTSDALNDLIIETIKSDFERQKQEAIVEVSGAKDIEQWRNAVSRFDTKDNSGFPLLVFNRGITDSLNISDIDVYDSYYRANASISSLIAKDNIVISHKKTPSTPDRVDVAVLNTIGHGYNNSKMINAYLDENDVVEQYSVAGHYQCHNLPLEVNEKMFDGRKEPWWFPKFMNFEDYTSNYTKLVETLFDVKFITSTDIREEVKSAGRKIVKDNPEKFNTTRRVSTASPLYVISSNGDTITKEELDNGVTSVREYIKDNGIKTVMCCSRLDNNMFSQITDDMWNDVVDANIMVVYGNKAYSRIDRSVSADNDINGVNVIDSIYINKRAIFETVIRNGKYISELHKHLKDANDYYASYNHLNIIKFRHFDAMNKVKIDGVGLGDYIINNTLDNKGNKLSDDVKSNVYKGLEIARKWDDDGEYRGYGTDSYYEDIANSLYGTPLYRQWCKNNGFDEAMQIIRNNEKFQDLSGEKKIESAIKLSKFIESM